MAPSRTRWCHALNPHAQGLAGAIHNHSQLFQKHLEGGTPPSRSHLGRSPRWPPGPHTAEVLVFLSFRWNERRKRTEGGIAIDRGIVLRSFPLEWRTAGSRPWNHQCFAFFHSPNRGIALHRTHLKCSIGLESSVTQFGQVSRGSQSSFITSRRRPCVGSFLIPIFWGDSKHWNPCLPSPMFADGTVGRDCDASAMAGMLPPSQRRTSAPARGNSTGFFPKPCAKKTTKGPLDAPFERWNHSV